MAPTAGTANSADLEQLIDSTVTIPTIPTTLVEITRVLASEDGSAREASEIIEKDPAIAAKVLRLVNSSFYALRNPVSAIPLACSMVGLKMIRNIVVQASVLDSVGDSKTCEGFDPDWLWDHSFKTALAARLLTEAAGETVAIDKDDAYTCGLVHDIGKMVLLEHQHEKFGTAVAQSRREKVSLALAEQAVFGFTHADVVGLLAERWKLASALRDAVVHHHATDPGSEEFEKGLLIRCANAIAHRAASRRGGYDTDPVNPEHFARLGVEPATVDEICAAVSAQSAER